MAVAAAQQQRRGAQQSNGNKHDDDSTDGVDDEDDEQTDDTDDDELHSSLRRRRRWSVEEEKELTPHQYITHMMEVGELLLNNLHLLADANGGTRMAATQQSQQHSGRLRRLMRRIDCRRGGRRLCRAKRRTSRNGRVERSSERVEAGEEDEEDGEHERGGGGEEQLEQERSEKQQLLLDISKSKANGYHHHTTHGNGVNGRSRDDREDGGHLLSLSLLSPSVARRRTPHSPFPPSTATATTRSNPATPTAATRTLSSPPSSLPLPYHSSSSPSHVVGVRDGGGRRYCFHVPPHNSISHLHLHCFELPLDGWWSEWSFRANTRWCKEAETVKREIERVNKAAVAATAPG